MLAVAASTAATSTIALAKASKASFPLLTALIVTPVFGALVALIMP